MRGGIALVLILAACSDEQAKHVFTTSATYTGDFGGVVAADGKCAEVAQAAALEGTFIAIISDATTHAIDRIADVGPWELPTGQVVFNTREDIGMVPLVALNVDERGKPVGGCAWTGSKIGAKLAPELCMGWTVKDLSTVGRTGNPTVNDNRWIEGASDCGVKTCNLAQHFYCIQQ
jgi:hypothetical protein